MSNCILGVAAAGVAGCYLYSCKSHQLDALVDPLSQTAILPDGSRVQACRVDKPLLEFLHEDARTIYEAYNRGHRINPNANMMGTRSHQAKEANDYQWMSYSDFHRDSHHFAAGLLELGIPSGQSTIVGIFSKNRPEWIITEMAVYANSMVISPLYETLGLVETLYVCKLTEMPLVVVDCASKAKLLLKNKSELSALKHIVVIDPKEKDLMELESIASPLLVAIHTYAAVLEKGKAVAEYKPSPPKPEYLATICFTSGTTAMPKGVMLTHGNCVADATTLLNINVPSVAPFNKNDVMMSFLPLAHMFERMMELVMFSVGGSVGYYRGDVKGLADDIKALRPTIMPVVPRVLNKVYDKVQAEAGKSIIRSYLLNTAIAIKSAEMRRFVVRNDSTLDNHVFKKIRDSLGGRLRIMVTGSAPISDAVMTFMRAALGCIIIEGYGQTECVAGATMTIAGDSNTGHVGIPIPAARIRLVDVPDMDYIADKNGGEVCIKGPIVFKGYYKNEEETAKTLDADGWLHTGDIGRWTPQGTLKIVDRKKHIFKLAQGEYLAPEKIENIYISSKFVAQCYVYGESLKICAIAIVVPDSEVLVPHCKTIMELDLSFSELCANEKVKKLIMSDMIVVGKNGNLHSFEQVKDIYLLSDPFTVENDLLTPTMKAKRPNIKKRYAQILADMYSKLD